MLKVGLTGGIGSGKSIVAKVFENIGVPVYYSDLRAKHIMMNDVIIKEQIIQLLGFEAYEDNSINKTFIASKIFTDTSLLKKLNNIVHPAIKCDFLLWADIQKFKFVIQESAILFESKAYEYMDCSMMVFAPLEVRINRVIERDSLTRSEVEKRIANQMADEEKLKLADYAINNFKDYLVVPQVLTIYKALFN
ncbi:MAG: dephospho-CoA kinase [Bacteroidota bacterium]